MPKPNLDHLSYSSISSYLLCGEYWRRRYVAKEAMSVSSSALLGSAFHGAIESHLKDATELEVAYERSWNRQIERSQDVAWGDEQPDAVKADGLRMVRAKAVRQTISQLAANFDATQGKTERRIALQVPGVPIPVIGYIDIITKDGVPGDIKTAARMWTDEKASEELQPLFYIAALNQEGHTTWTFRHYVFSKGQYPTGKVFETQHTPMQIFGLFEIIQAAWRGIEAGIYLIQPNTWKCSAKYCEYWASCRGKYVPTVSS